MHTLLFAENLKYLRDLSGLTQAEMFAVLGFKRSTWNGYENGDSFPALADLIKIAGYFGITETDLLHTEITESDLIALYTSYINTQESLETIGATPHAKDFKTYFEGHFSAIGGYSKPDSVTDSVTNAVTKGTKHAPKPYGTGSASGAQTGIVVREPGATYGKKGKASDSARIDAMEATLLAIKDILMRFNP